MRDTFLAYIIAPGATVGYTEGRRAPALASFPELPVFRLSRLTNAELGGHSSSKCGVQTAAVVSPRRGQLQKGGQFREALNISPEPTREAPWSADEGHAGSRHVASPALSKIP